MNRSNYDNPLNHIETLEILEKLEKYKRTDLRRVSDQDLFNLTLDTFPVLNIISVNLTPGTLLYRIRSKEKGKFYKKIHEVIYPNPKIVTKIGRLNGINEAILYTSLDKATPFYESKIPDRGLSFDNSFSLTEFEVMEDANLQLTSIGLNDESPDTGLNEVGRINNKILEQFLYTEFSKDVREGTEYLYRISNMLVKNFYDIPHCDGYLYPSVEFKNGLNAAIKPDSVDRKLKVNKVTNLNVMNISDEGSVEAQIESESIFINLNGDIIY